MWQFGRSAEGLLRPDGGDARSSPSASAALRVVSESGKLPRQIAGDSAALQRSEADRSNTYVALQNDHLFQIRMLRRAVQQVRGNSLASLESHRRCQITWRARIRHGAHSGQ